MLLRIIIQIITIINKDNRRINKTFVKYNNINKNGIKYLRTLSDYNKNLSLTNLLLIHIMKYFIYINVTIIILDKFIIKMDLLLTNR
jgi:hypothetical protein